LLVTTGDAFDVHQYCHPPLTRVAVPGKVDSIGERGGGAWSTDGDKWPGGKARMWWKHAALPISPLLYAAGKGQVQLGEGLGLG